MSYLLRYESHPLVLGSTIRCHGLRFAYWTIRNAGASRWAALRSIFFAMGGR